MPFEQSKLSVSSLATLARKSYGIPAKAADYIGLGGAAVLAPSLVPHATVAFIGVAATGTLAVAVVGSIGVIAGAAASPRAAEAIARMRRGIRRLIHRPPADDAVSAPDATSEPVSEKAAQQEAKEAAERAAKEDQEQHARQRAEKRARLREQYMYRWPHSGPGLTKE